MYIFKEYKENLKELNAVFFFLLLITRIKKSKKNCISMSRANTLQNMYDVYSYVNYFLSACNVVHPLSCHNRLQGVLCSRMFQLMVANSNRKVHCMTNISL